MAPLEIRVRLLVTLEAAISRAIWFVNVAFAALRVTAPVKLLLAPFVLKSILDAVVKLEVPPTVRAPDCEILPLAVTVRF